MRLSDAELQWMQTRLAQRYAAAGSKAREALERKLARAPAGSGASDKLVLRGQPPQRLGKL